MGLFEKYIYMNSTEFKVSARQSSDGRWYCSEITVNGKCHEQLKARLDRTIQDVIVVLNRYNKDMSRGVCLKREKTFTKSLKKGKTGKPLVKGLE